MAIDLSEQHAPVGDLFPRPCTPAEWEQYRLSDELTRGHEKRRVPENIVQRGLDAPRAEGVKEDSAWIAGFVRVILVPEIPSVVGRIDEFGQLAP